MSVSKKDIEAIAASIAEADMSTWPFPKSGPGISANSGSRLDAQETERLRAQVALMMADTLCAASDAFDPIRFVRSCGIKHTSLSETGIRNYSRKISIRANSR